MNKQEQISAESIALDVANRISNDMQTIRYAGKDKAYEIGQQLAGEFLTKYEGRTTSKEGEKLMILSMLIEARHTAANQ